MRVESEKHDFGEITKYSLETEESFPAYSRNEIKTRSLRNADYARLYSGEDLICVNGVKYPAIVLGEFNHLDGHKVVFLDEAYTIPSRFKKFAKSVLEIKLRPDIFNGMSVGVKDIQNESGSIKLVVQKTGYFDFIATNLSQDVYMSQFDKSFEEQETLRDHEIVGTKAIPIQDSNLSNILGIGFVVYNQRQNSLIMAQRRNLAINPNTISILGGTPKWKNEYDGGVTSDLSTFLMETLEEEMAEELCLQRDEFSFNKGFFVRSVSTSPHVLMCVDVKTSTDEIADRCEKNKPSFSEHNSILELPFNRGSLNYLLRKNEGEVTPMSLVGLDLIMR